MTTLRPQHQTNCGLKSKSNRSIVIGKKERCNKGKINLQGVPKSLHLYRLAPDTKANMLIEFLNPMFPEIIVEKLQSR